MPVGYIGLGNMGGNMALRLLDQGQKLVVTDLSKDAARRVLDAGAEWAGTPAEVAARCSLILSSLPGPPQVEAVALGPNGIVEGITAGSLYADMSTSSPTLIRAVNDAFAAAGAAAIDTPVSGGPEQCRSGKLTILVGAQAAQLERARPVLDDLAREIIHVGPLGAGAVAKLVNNACTMVTLGMLSEVISVGVKAGIDHKTLLRVIQQGAYGQGLPLTFVMPNVVFKHKYDPPTFALALGRKDVGLLTSLGRELNVPMPLTNLTEQSAVELIGRGFGGLDTSAVFSLQESRAGVVMHDDDAAELDL